MTAPETPPPAAIGPYRIVEKLGRGGMGIVYRATHEGSGATVALKTVRVTHAGLLQSIRREIHALARIRHPGIVRIVDEGVQDGLPWYAMELYEGVGLRGHFASGPTVPLASGAAEAPTAPESGAARAETPDLGSGLQETVRMSGTEAAAPTPAAPAIAPAREEQWHIREPELRRVVTLVRALCSPIGYLHGEGIVHRDLKPDNILVRGNGAPVIVDFGLMSLFAGGLSRDALQVAGEVSGTIAYMAPEQARGELVDARADLYALGCILYELLTGRVPFIGKSASMIVWQHLSAEPAPPSRLVRGLPIGLDDLVLRLLAKEPRDRLGYADDVAAALARFAPGDDPFPDAPSARSYLYRPGLAGRNDVKAVFEKRLQGLASGSGGFLPIAGESGVGKTRLLMELAGAAARRKVNVLTGECPQPMTDEERAEGTAGAPLQALRRALQAVGDRCRELGREETRRLLGRSGALLALYEPALGDLPGHECIAKPPELRPEAARLRLFTFLAETFAALAAIGPLLIVIDDLQWADDLTLGFVDHVLRSGHLERASWLLAVTYRPEEVGPALFRILDRKEVGIMPVGRLPERAVAEMVADMLGRTGVPDAFVAFMARHSEGNPFFVSEYLRAAVAARILDRDARGAWQVRDPTRTVGGTVGYEKIELPGSIRELVAHRLDGLDREARRLADVASVLGPEMDPALLARVAGMGENAAMEALDRLTARHVIEEVTAGAFRFVHKKLQEVAYEHLPEDQRRRLHRAAAEAISAESGEERGEHLTALAEHWEEAGVSDRARACYLSAARRAEERCAYKEAARLLGCHLALCPQPTVETVAVRNERGEMLRHTGLAGRALDEHGKALEESRALGDRSGEVRSLRGLAPACQFTGKMKEAEDHYRAALALAAGDPSEEARVQQGLGSLCQLLGRADEARALYDQAVATFRRLENRKNEASTLMNLAALHAERGQVSEGLALCERALALSRKLAFRPLEAILLCNLATMYQSQGRLLEAEGLYAEGLAAAREVGDARTELLALGNVGICEHQRGRHARARELYQEALDLSRRVSDPHGEASTLHQLATLELHTGEARRARALGLESLALHQKLGDRRMEGATLVLLGTVARRCEGDLDWAEQLLARARSCLEEIGDTLELCKCLCEEGHLALARGADASQVLARVRDLTAALPIEPASEVARAVKELESAVEAARTGGAASPPPPPRSVS